jgi:hypothetical protein
MNRKHSLYFSGFAVLLLTAVFTLTGCPNPSDPGPQGPGEPGDLTVTAAENQLTASWSTVSSADSYEAQITGGVMQEKEITQTSVTFTGLDNGTEYTIRVRAKNARGASEYHEAKGTPVAATTAPDAPAAPAVTAAYNVITVSWTGVTGATKYQVYYGASGDPGSAVQLPGDITGGLEAAITVTATGPYYVWVKAGNSKGWSGYSPAATATVTSLDPVIGTWTRTRSDGTVSTFQFKDDGTLEVTWEYDDGPETDSYTYDSATKKIY